MAIYYKHNTLLTKSQKEKKKSKRKKNNNAISFEAAAKFGFAQCGCDFQPTKSLQLLEEQEGERRGGNHPLGKAI